MQRNILSTILLSAAMAMGFRDEEPIIKKANPINRNQKDNQTKDEVDLALKKAILKRERKANRGRGFAK